MPEKSKITLADIVNILVEQAPRGMGNHTEIVTYIFGSFYQEKPISKSYRTTISKALANKCNFPPKLIEQYKKDYNDLEEMICGTLRLYPGVARLSIIRDQVNDLVSQSNMLEWDKCKLCEAYQATTLSSESVGTYVADVMHCILRCA